MKPPAFEYSAPTDIEETLALLHEYGDEAKVLAGGQSLVPLLNMRLTHPRRLIDINGLSNQRFVHRTNDHLEIGCLTRHVDLERDDATNNELPILRRAADDIASLAVRNRGTFCGSLCHGDPAAEWPLVAVLTNATVQARSKTGSREIPAESFFVDRFTTALEPTELVVGTDIPIHPPTWGWSFMEFNVRSGDPAIVAVAVLLEVNKGRIATAYLALAGIGGTVRRFQEVENSLVGEKPCDTLWAAAGSSVASMIEPDSDLQATADFRRHLASQLSERALREAASRVSDAP